MPDDYRALELDSDHEDYDQGENVIDKHIDSANMQGLRCLAVCGFISFVGLGSGMIYFAVSKCYLYSESHDVHYFSSLGLGLVQWGILFALFGVWVAAYGCSTGTLEAFKAGSRPILQGLTGTRIRVVFGRPEVESISSSSRLAKCFVLLGRTALNATFITTNMLFLPERNPTERANQAKHVVSWFEFPVLVVMTMILLWSICKRKNPSRIVDKIAGISRFSVLQNISLISMDRMMDMQVRLRRMGVGASGAVFTVALFLPLLGLSVASLLVKVTQVDFVTERTYSDWTLFEWFRLASFANSIVGIINLRSIQENVLRKQMEIAENEIRQDIFDDWMHQLDLLLIEVYGYSKACMIEATIRVDDLILLLSSRQMLDLSEVGIEREADQFIESASKYLPHPERIVVKDRINGLQGVLSPLTGPKACFSQRPVYKGTLGNDDTEQDMFLLFAGGNMDSMCERCWVITGSANYEHAKNLVTFAYAKDQSLSPALIANTWQVWNGPGGAFVAGDHDFSFEAEPDDVSNLRLKMATLRDDALRVLKSARASMTSKNAGNPTEQHVRRVKLELQQLLQ